MEKSPISILQEICAQSNRQPPNYFIEEIVQHGIQQFLCTCTCGSRASQAVAQNKRDAKTESANIMLAILYSLDDKMVKQKMSPVTIKSGRDAAKIYNYVGDLNEYASSNNTAYPAYKDKISNDLTKGMFMMECSFLDLESRGYGANKKQAKQAAAKEMLEKIKILKPTIVPRSSQLNAVTQLQPDIEEVIIKYKNLSTKSTEKKTANLTSRTNLDLICDSNMSSNFYAKFTTSELMNKLKAFNMEYEIETFQMNPLVLYIKIPSRNLTLMAAGKNRDEALHNLLETTVRILERNFSNIFL